MKHIFEYNEFNVDDINFTTLYSFFNEKPRGPKAKTHFPLVLDNGEIFDSRKVMPKIKKMQGKPLQIIILMTGKKTHTVVLDTTKTYSKSDDINLYRNNSLQNLFKIQFTAQGPHFDLKELIFSLRVDTAELLSDNGGNTGWVKGHLTPDDFLKLLDGKEVKLYKASRSTLDNHNIVKCNSVTLKFLK